MLSLALALAAASVADQMAPALSGMLQCHSPDVLFKSCLSLSKVQQVGPNKFQFETRFVIDPNGPVILTERNIVTVQGSAVCEPVHLSAIDRWTVEVGGKPANAAQSAKYRSAIKRFTAPLAGKVVCTAIVANEQEMHKVIATIGGKRAPAYDYPMKWVDPEDGWTVAP